ncbi:MAG TPA: OmpA family protein [Paracoccaceae bacterium]|nr:OmpA family protein [Paracoccaceae bacterium]
MKRTAVAAILLAALGACEARVGGDGTWPFYGEATAMNLAAQQAYVAGNARLRDLSQAFQASTDEVVTFAFDKAALDATARRALDTQARWLREHPQVRMTIVGHADLVGPERYNFGLGLRRARNALEYLVGKGVVRDRLVAVESRGETDPIVPTTSRERLNRRAVTMVAGFAQGYVGTGLDGEYAQRVYDVYQTGEIGVTEATSDIIE